MINYQDRLNAYRLLKHPWILNNTETPEPTYKIKDKIDMFNNMVKFSESKMLVKIIASFATGIEMSNDEE